MRTFFAFTTGLFGGFLAAGVLQSIAEYKAEAAMIDALEQQHLQQQFFKSDSAE